jgi:PleD family two-component response regulator
MKASPGRRSVTPDLSDRARTVSIPRSANPSMKHILVVDDEPTMAALLTRILSATRYRVTTRRWL